MTKYLFSLLERLLVISFCVVGNLLLTRISAQDGTSTEQQQGADYIPISESDELLYPGKTLRNGILSLANHYESAILADPTSVPNHVGLADAYAMYWCFGFCPRDDVLPKIKLAALKAVELDGQDGGAHTALGIAKLSQWDWSGAEKELATAVHLDPYRAQSHHWYALYLAARGRHREAMREDELLQQQSGRGCLWKHARTPRGPISTG